MNSIDDKIRIVLAMLRGEVPQDDHSARYWRGPPTVRLAWDTEGRRWAFLPRT